MPRVAGIVSATVIASLVVLSASTPASAASTPTPGCPAVSAAHPSSETAANKAMVTYFYDQLFIQHNLSSSMRASARSTSSTTPGSPTVPTYCGHRVPTAGGQQTRSCESSARATWC